MKKLFLIFDDCKILHKDLHQLILDYEKKWNYSISSSHWVVYAKGNYFIAALPHDMQDPRGAYRAMGEQKMCDLTQVNIEDKMKQLAEEGTTKIGEKIGFQVLQDEENHPRNILCNFLSWGKQAGTIPEIQQALLDIQAFQRKRRCVSGRAQSLHNHCFCAPDQWNSKTFR